MKFLFIIPLILLYPIAGSGQGIAINADGALPNVSAMMDIKSNAKGLLIPRMSTAQRKAIAGASAGLLVFDLDKSTIYLFDGQKWQAMLFTNSDAVNPPIGRSASDGAVSDKLGSSVGISGDYAIAGAPLDDVGTHVDQGCAYIFVRQDGLWTEQAKLIASDGAGGENFGACVSISGDYAVVGAPKASGAWSLQGAVYVFVRSGTSWIQQAKLNASDGIIGDYFGTSVNLSGSDLIVGVPSARVTFASQGAAYIFVRSGTSWAQQSKLVVSYGEYNENFGYSVSINGPYAIVGSPFRDGNINVPDVGAAYIFLRTGSSWAMQTDLFHSGADAGDLFGYSVSINGSYAVVGAPDVDDVPLTDNGSVFIYLRNGVNWGVPVIIKAPDPQTQSYFGNSVSLNTDNIIVGCFYNDVGSNVLQGSAYLYQRSGTAWNLTRKTNDGSGQSGGLFGNAVGVSGFNYVMGSPGKNSSKGEISFLNIE